MKRAGYLAKRRKALARVSAIQRSEKATARKAAPRGKKRKPSEFARIYHSVTFVEWIKTQPSVASGRGPCEAAHVVKGDGGMGRKSGWESCAPLTHHEHVAELHQWGPQTFEAHYGISLEDAAARTRADWLAHLAEQVAA